MIEMYVAGLGVHEQTSRPLVILTDRNGIRSLPILLGPGEAEVVALAGQEATQQQLNNQSLLLQLVKELGLKAAQVTLQRNGYGACLAKVRFAPISLFKRAGAEDITIETSVYDGAALALRANLPIGVPEDILSDGGVPANPEAEKKQTDQFKEFVKSAKPSDFKLPKASV